MIPISTSGIGEQSIIDKGVIMGLTLKVPGKYLLGLPFQGILPFDSGYGRTQTGLRIRTKPRE